MFKSFFFERKWQRWSILGTIVLIGGIWLKVRIDVKINEWFGTFYNLIQETLKAPNSVTFADILSSCKVFMFWAALYIVLVVFQDFFSSHYVFRWRSAMNEYYVKHWARLRHIEGAAQRVQEDTMRFANILEGLGETFIRAILTLIAFLPILWVLSEHVKVLPWIGEVSHSLVWIALLVSVVGTALLAVIGGKLPQLQFNNQMVEAAYRKELVLGEDDVQRAQPQTLQNLYGNVRHNYFTLYFHYLYFNLVKYSYLQATVILPYIALAPSLIAATITLGIMQQIINAFNKVENAFQFLFYSWSSIVELISIYRRLRRFEKTLEVQ